MTDTQKIEYLKQELANALSRIGQLERKVETMRGRINANFNGHTQILQSLAEDTGSTRNFVFVGVDVAEAIAILFCERTR